MLGSSTHAFKVNFCKFTNETRLYLEDASAHSGLQVARRVQRRQRRRRLRAGAGVRRDRARRRRQLAVAFPEVPLLAVLPGTGGLTRLVDKRKVRRDLADVFSTPRRGREGQARRASGAWSTSPCRSRSFDGARRRSGPRRWPTRRRSARRARASSCRRSPASTATTASSHRARRPCSIDAAHARRPSSRCAAPTRAPPATAEALRARAAEPVGAARVPRARRRAARPALQRARDRRASC